MNEANLPNSDLISALAGGEIEAGEAAAVRAALDADADLREDYESLLATASLLAGAPAIRAPRDYRAALPPVQISNWCTRFTTTLMATAVVALIAFALVDLQGSRVGGSERVRAKSRTAVTAATPALAAAPLAGARAIETEAETVIEPQIEAAAAPLPL